MAYFCLTVLEHSTGIRSGRRRKAAEKYGIEFSDLNRVGKLTGVKGGQEARKSGGRGEDQEYTPEDRQFLESTVKRMIQRAVEVAFDAKGQTGRRSGPG